MAEFEAGPDGFTRRHYEAIAATLKGERPNRLGVERERVTWAGIADAFADMLESGNPRFDRARFLKACGVES